MLVLRQNGTKLPATNLIGLLFRSILQADFNEDSHDSAKLRQITQTADIEQVYRGAANWSDGCWQHDLIGELYIIK